MELLQSIERKEKCSVCRKKKQISRSNKILWLLYFKKEAARKKTIKLQGSNRSNKIFWLLFFKKEAARKKTRKLQGSK